MKKIIIALLCLFPLFAKADDTNEDDQIGKIVLTSFVDDELIGIPSASANLLRNKLNQIVLQNGVGGTLSQRFIITASVDVLTKDITSTAPPMHAVTVNINFYVGDGIDGTLFSSSSITSKGVGETETKAYNAALKSVKTSSADVKDMVNKGKERIVDYYNSIAPDLIKKAESLQAAEEYDEAILVLAAIPNACQSYSTVEDKICKIYLAKIDHESKPILAKAQALWSAEPSPENAEKVMTILAEIDPDAPCYSEAQALMKKVEATYVSELNRKRALEERAYQDAKAREERNFQAAESHYKDDLKMRKEQQAHDNSLDELRIKSATKVAVKQAKNQPRKIKYNVSNWVKK